MQIRQISKVDLTVCVTVPLVKLYETALTCHSPDPGRPLLPFLLVGAAPLMVVPALAAWVAGQVSLEVVVQDYEQSLIFPAWSSDDCRLAADRRRQLS